MNRRKPTTKKTRKAKNGETLNLNVDLPAPIRKAIDTGAKDSLRTLRAEVTIIAARHYGLSEYLPAETTAAG